jgi:TolB-like protein
MHAFLEELRRRKVIRVAVAYIAVGLAVIGTSANVLPSLELDQAHVFVIVAVSLGFPIALALAWAYDLHPEAPRPTRPARVALLPVAGSELASVAVMPFRNLTAPAELGYLAEALPLEINSTLSRVPKLRVISHRTSMAHAGTEHGLGALAAELGVQFVISGAVAQAGKRIKVITELGDAETDTVLWSRTFEVDPSGLGEVPNEIAAAVVGEFGGERLRAEVLKLAATTPQDATAWQCVQMSRAYLLDYTEVNLAKAVASLRKALELDPDYAVAHATLGQVLAEKTLAGASVDPAANRREALAEAARAEALAPRDPIVLRAAGCVRAYAGDYRRSTVLLRRALELAPYDFGTWGYLGWPLVASGNPDDLAELVGILDRLLQTAPKHPGRGYWLFHRSVACLLSGDPDAAVEPARQSLAEQPKFSVVGMHLANVLGAVGATADARLAAADCIAANPRFTADYYTELMRVLSDQAAVVALRTSGLRSAGLVGG